MTNARSSAARPVVEDLQRIFGNRLAAVVAYGWRQHGAVPTLALVHSISLEDLNACAERAGAWRKQGAATPLLLTREDFGRSLDAFPIEYGEIIANHEVVFGDDPFIGLSIGREDLRRACEVQVKSHLLHLREDYLEAGGRRGEIDALVRESAPGFGALLRHLARLDQAAAHTAGDLVEYARTRLQLDPRVVGDLLAVGDSDGMPGIDTVKVFPGYLHSMERLAEFVDRWRAA
jgi:hypothetical protein